MTPAERLLLETIRPFANANDREWADIEAMVQSGIKVTDLTGVAKTVVTDAIAKATRQSFGGNRSAAGAYAASVRWGRRGDSTSGSTSGNIGGEGGGMTTDHNLNTNRPVERRSDGTLVVQAENGGWRAPTAQERGIPTATDLKQLVKPELDELDATQGSEKAAVKRLVNNSTRALNEFHRDFDAIQGWGRHIPPDFAMTPPEMRQSRFKANADKIAWNHGTAMTSRGASPDPKIVAIADRLSSKLLAVAQQMLTLKEPAR